MRTEVHNRHQNNHSKSLYSLQVLRAIAATSVVYFHIGVIPVFGGFGIDIFFVISGFVMAMVIADGQSARIFGISRVARIVPLYWTLTTCVLILAIIKPELFNSTTANIHNYLKSLFFIPYFKESRLLQPMLFVGWTLNYEMFFYLCIWLSIVLYRRFYFLLTLIFLVLTYVIFGKISDNNVLHTFFGNTLLFEFVFGMIAYYIYRHQNPKTSLNSIILIAVAILSYVFMVYLDLFGPKIDRLYGYGLPSVLLVLSITFLEGTIFSCKNILTNIGDASYATYLSHYFVIDALKKFVFIKLSFINIYTPFGVLITLGLTLITGQIIYVYCDKPLSRKFKNFILSLYSK